MADPDPELRRVGGGRGGAVFFVACPAGFSSFYNSLFFPLVSKFGGLEKKRVSKNRKH